MTSGRLKTEKDTDMDSTIGVLVRYGYLVVFGSILAEQIGLPFPAIPFLLLHLTQRGFERPCGADLETPRHRACAAPRGRIPGLARPRLPDDGADRCDRDRAGDEPRPGAGLELSDLGSTPHSGENHFARQMVSGSGRA